MKYTTVIFDLDGTLLDTLQDLTDSVNYALGCFRFETKTMAQIRSYVGNGVEVLMKKAIPCGASNPDFPVCFQAFKQHYYTNCLNKTKPYDGIYDLLEQLKLSGINSAIVSNKFDSAVKRLSDLFFSEYITVAIGETQEIRRKPYPDTIFECVKQLGVSLDECIFAGDSETDIQTAKNAGIPCISVAWGFRTEQQLISSGASRIISSPNKLLHCL